MQTLDVSNLRPTIVPKSDQLNAEQLLCGPIDITVTEVRIGGTDEQPISLHYEDDNGRPYKPCKTVRKVLIFAWGEDGRAWIGRSMRLFNDPSVKFGGAEVGGIRVSHLSDIPKDLHVNLTATKGKKAPHVIKTMQASKPKPTAQSAEDLADKVTAEVNAGHAKAQAAILAKMPEREFDAAWKLLAGDIQDALTEAWPA